MLVRLTPSDGRRRFTTQPGRVAAATLGLGALGLVGHAVVTGARFEQVVAGLGLAAASALVALIASAGDGGVSVVAEPEARRPLG